MNQSAQPAAEGSDARFQITGRMSVLSQLTTHVNHRDQFTLYFNGRQESFLTCLLSVNPEANEMIVDCSGSQEINDRFLKSTQNHFEAQPEGVAVRFGAGKARAVTFDGGAAFALPLPRSVVRLQRREYFRIITPVARPLTLTVALPGQSGKPMQWPIHDLAVVGCGVNSPLVPPDFSIGLMLPDCRFTLPDAQHTVVKTSALVRHATALSNHHGQHLYRIGLHFDELEHAMEHRIQRYMVHIEHERHEHSK